MGWKGLTSVLVTSCPILYTGSSRAQNLGSPAPDRVRFARAHSRQTLAIPPPLLFFPPPPPPLLTALGEGEVRRGSPNRASANALAGRGPGPLLPSRAAQ